MYRRSAEGLFLPRPWGVQGQRSFTITEQTTYQDDVWPPPTAWPLHLLRKWVHLEKKKNNALRLLGASIHLHNQGHLS